ncbi:efflux transporter outer membrane subunit [Chitinilyticum litopenaei]|uniref:efflux transporter outer membrane subunit n=1 Tax=Chitinilyticum litopenaei TaxID=1121276 RepID=UPI0004260208|nr:efflux transporter outer membrane subunit [Chitinilyticum litopenaei]
MQTMMTRGAAAGLLLALLGGCASLAPDYRQPELPVPAGFTNQVSDGYASAAKSVNELQANTLDENAWRQWFADPALQATIAKALANNRDWRIAMLNVEKARAQYGIAAADRWPTLSADGSGTHQRRPADNGGQPQVSHDYAAVVGISGFELDLFGRVRNLSDAAWRSYQASGEVERSARLSLIANVANGWYALAAEQERLKVAEATLASRRDTQKLIERRFAAGISGELELREAQTQAETAAVDVERYRTQVAQARNALQLLVGAPVEATSLPAGWQDRAVPGVPPVPGNLASDVLLARPDVREAEQRLRAADANIGAARAAFFPRITLTANAGAASSELSQLFQAGSGSWLFMPQISLPIFDGGRNQSNLDAAKADRELAVASYEKAVQTGFREVADGLAQIDGDAGQLAAQARVLAASGQALKLAQARFEKGVAGYLDVLIAQRSHYSAQLVQIALQQQQAANQIGLYKALALY